MRWMGFSVVLLGSMSLGAGCGPSAAIVDDTCGQAGEQCGSGSETNGDDDDDDDDDDTTGDGDAESGGTTEGREPSDSDGGTTDAPETTSSGDDGSEAGDGSSDDGDPVDDDLLELSECPEVTAESVYCLTTAGGGLDVVGVDTGTQCPLGPGFGDSPTSLGWIGNDVYACPDSTGNADFALAHVDLTSGILEVSEVACGAAAALDDQILTIPFSPSGSVLTYDSFGDATMGISSSIDFSPQASRVTAGGDTIYAAWHSTDVLERYSVTDQTPLPDLVMGGYDSWVQGMSVVGNRLFVVTWSGTLLELDATTGDQVSESLGWPGQGLACRAGTG